MAVAPLDPGYDIVRRDNNLVLDKNLCLHGMSERCILLRPSSLGIHNIKTVNNCPVPGLACYNFVKENYKVGITE